MQSGQRIDLCTLINIAWTDADAGFMGEWHFGSRGVQLDDCQAIVTARPGYPKSFLAESLRNLAATIESLERADGDDVADATLDDVAEFHAAMPYVCLPGLREPKRLEEPCRRRGRRRW
jgi:hypothetical protein